VAHQSDAPLFFSGLVLVKLQAFLLSQRTVSRTARDSGLVTTVVLKVFVMVSVAVRDAERSADENKGTVFDCIATLSGEFSIGHDKLLSRE
jgi:hypothetical protein